ncbi:MAG: type II toxin-antitoxin system RelE/ParE family toxin, partial [Bacteroidetes bacterium]|nr:type II toxin-antitoxin system RelE/ParE family toxin [Bacteroidota bacterium]
NLGNNCYKIRLAIASKGKGKSGGARVITNFVIAEETVFLISIYDKSEKENLTDKELNELLKYVPV